MDRTKGTEVTKTVITARVRHSRDFAQSEHTGGMIALVPDRPGVFTLPGGDPSSEMHCTLVYLGDNVIAWPEQVAEKLRGEVARLAAARGAVTAHVLGIAQWNRDGGPTGEFDPCTVTQLQGGGHIQSMRDYAMGLARAVLGEGLMPKQHEPYLPHVTAGFKVTGEPKAKGEQTFSTLRLALGPVVYDFPLTGFESEPVNEHGGYQAKDVIEMTDTATKAPEVPADTAVPAFFPCLAVEGMQTSDGRYIEPGGLTARAMPLTIWAQTKNTGQGGHSGAEVVGKLTEAWKIPGPEFVSRQTGKALPDGTFVWQGRGEVDTATEGGKLAAKGYLVGNSIDLGAADFADEILFNEDGTEDHRVTVTKAELAATTLCAIPAFPDAYVELDGKTLAPPVNEEGALAELYKIITDAGFEPVTASMMIEGYDQCSPCLFAAQEELGTLPPALRKKADEKKAQAKDSDDDEDDDETDDDGKPDFLKKKIAGAKGGKAKARTASSGAGYPPIDAFADPGFPEPTPLTIDGDRIFGHIATWGTCHIGITKRCTPPPKSATDYAYFNTGAKRVRDHNGEVRTVGVGHLTMNTGHAALTAGLEETLAHYDNTGTVAATVAAGEDAHGIWINGLVEPGLSDADRDKLASAPPSGDWRPVNGKLELVGVLAVNVPGYPVPRARVASVGDGETEVVALVAAGATRPATDFGPGGLDYDKLAKRIAQELAATLRPVAPPEDIQAVQEELGAELAGLERDSIMDELDTLADGELAEDVTAWVDAVTEEVRRSDETFQLLADNVADGTGKVTTFDQLTAAATFNWVDKVGGLPKFITRIKKHLMKKGMTESHAIATAVNVVKKMCATGDTNFPGKQNVNAGSKAEACAAAASWERKKAQAKAD